MVGPAWVPAIFPERNRTDRSLTPVKARLPDHGCQSGTLCRRPLLGRCDARTGCLKMHWVMLDPDETLTSADRGDAC